MENLKRHLIPSPPNTPDTPVMPDLAAEPETPNTADTPDARDAEGTGSTPGDVPQMSIGENAFQLPSMPPMPPMPTMPTISLEGFKMAGFMEEQMEHHKKHHLDANGDCKPHLKEEGFKFMKKFMD